jgi:hypothetical protein
VRTAVNPVDCDQVHLTRLARNALKSDRLSGEGHSRGHHTNNGVGDSASGCGVDSALGSGVWWIAKVEEKGDVSGG